MEKMSLRWGLQSPAIILLRTVSAGGKCRLGAGATWRQRLESGLEVLRIDVRQWHFTSSADADSKSSVLHPTATLIFRIRRQASGIDIGIDIRRRIGAMVW
jgi:hypothetical protein